MLHTPPMSLTPDAAETLRRLIEESGRPLRNLAREAGVPFDALWRWMRCKQDHYNLVSAELVYHHLTGKGFIEVAESPADGEIQR